MNLLAIETATEACSVALHANDRVYAKDVVEPRCHARLILPLIHELLEEAHIKVRDLDAIAVSIGPGSFVGLRIAMSVAQGLAAPFDIPLLPISTLRVIAATAYAKYAMPHVLVAMDAHMGGIYLGKYRLEENKAMCAIAPDQLIQPEALTVDEDGWLGVGSAWTKYQAPLKNAASKLQRCEPVIYPSASDLLALALLDDSKECFFKADDVLPVYLREESAWKRQ
jgi:tRNA threonylcarbamoyladenosine biosynthesis protein TsaB